MRISEVETSGRSTLQDIEYQEKESGISEPEKEESKAEALKIKWPKMKNPKRIKKIIDLFIKVEKIKN